MTKGQRRAVGITASVLALLATLGVFVATVTVVKPGRIA